MDADDHRFLARTALILFIAGITIPFLIAIFASDEIAMGFGLVSEVLALILGALSWRHRLGKVTVVGVSVLLALSGINYVLFLKAGSAAKKRMQDEAEKAEKVMRGNR